VLVADDVILLYSSPEDFNILHNDVDTVHNINQRCTS